jgi:hypothetical protein
MPWRVLARWILNPDATVTVVAPSGVWRRRVKDVVSSRADWIVQKQDKISQHDRKAERKLVSGESLPYLGRNYQIKLVYQTQREIKASMKVERGQFLITVGRRWSRERKQEAIRTVLRGWYRDRAYNYINGVAERYSQRLGVKYRSIQIYEMQTRWGSGGTSGRLRFNWRTFMAPRRLVEYVVVHELCHLRHDHHSPAFWRMLAAAMPDYEQRRLELAHLGPRFEF